MPGVKAPEEERREQILRAAFAVAVRSGLDGLTVRAVAAEAGLSLGLVPFHFKNKQALLSSLLDWLLDTSALANPLVAVDSTPDPASHLLRLVRHEVERAAGEVDRTSLFFDYWVRGLHEPEIRARIRRELAGYRAAFRRLAAAAIAPSADPARTSQRADAVAALAVALVEGCALQAVIGARDLDVAATAEASEALLASLLIPPVETADTANRGAATRPEPGRPAQRKARRAPPAGPGPSGDARGLNGLPT